MSETDHHPETDIVSERIFAAPPATVFDAFADPLKLARWFGPEGFTNTIEAFDFRPGGVWKITMHGPGGTDYPNLSIFGEIVPGAKIVYDHIEPVHRFTMTMTFSGHPGGCLLHWRMRFADPAEAARVGKFIAAANEQNFDRLQAVLSSSNH